MELLEIYADESGETHFRKSEIAFTQRDFAPPSQPIGVSAEYPVSTAVFMRAPQGWDEAYHPTPRKQFAAVLDGEITVTATDGETVRAGPGSLFLLNDAGSKGHLTRVRSQGEARFLMIGLED